MVIYSPSQYISNILLFTLLYRHISGRISHNPKGTAGSNKLISSSGAAAGSSDDVDITDQTIHVQHQVSHEQI